MENIEILRVPGNDDNLMRYLSLYLPYIHLSIMGSQRNFSVYVIVRDILSRNRRLRQLLSLMALHFVMDRECSGSYVKQVSYFLRQDCQSIPATVAGR
jgi:hypothetical protein